MTELDSKSRNRISCVGQSDCWPGFGNQFTRIGLTFVTRRLPVGMNAVAINSVVTGLSDLDLIGARFSVHMSHRKGLDAAQSFPDSALRHN
jgi:hypothetical protein